MGLPDDDRQALRTRLLPGDGRAADAIADAIDDGEELRETLTDVQGDVVAFTDQRALFVDHTGADVVAFTYGDIDVRRRQSGLGIDALVEDGRLVLDVAKGTFIRLAVVAAGAPPGRGTWLPTRTPAPAPPPPIPDATAVISPPAMGPLDAPVDVTRPPMPPVGSMPPVSTFPPVPPLAPERTQPQQHQPAGPSSGPAPVPPASQAPTPVPAPEQGPAVPPMPPPGLPPAGWNPDPSGRHWWRWWDGMSWTDHVADGGASFVDPLPPR